MQHCDQISACSRTLNCCDECEMRVSCDLNRVTVCPDERMQCFHFYKYAVLSLISHAKRLCLTITLNPDCLSSSVFDCVYCQKTIIMVLMMFDGNDDFVGPAVFVLREVAIDKSRLTLDLGGAGDTWRGINHREERVWPESDMRRSQKRRETNMEGTLVVTGMLETLQAQTLFLFIGTASASNVIHITHDSAEEMDHSVFCSTLTWGSGRGFLRAWRESAPERSLQGEDRKERKGKERKGKERNNRPTCYFQKFRM